MAPPCSSNPVSCIPGFTGNVLTPSSPLYGPANQRFSETAVLKPALIAQPASNDDISRVLKFALGQNPPLELAVKGGGVNPFPASSSNDIVIDLSLLNSVSVSGDKTTVTVGGGAKWGDVYAEADKHGVAVVGGSVHLVGVGGSALAGGYSPLSGKYGMAIDNMVSARVVLSDGRVVTTDATHEPDLWFAIRGGVNQFGVVTEMTFDAHPLPGAITIGSIGYSGDQLSNVLQALHDHLNHQDPSSKMILMFAQSNNQPTILILPYVEEQKTDPNIVLAPFRKFAKPLFEGLATVNNFTAVSHGADSSLVGPDRVSIDGALISDVWDDTVMSVYQSWEKFSSDSRFASSIVMWEFSHRDKIASIPVDSAAFAARDPHFYMTATGRYSDQADDAEVAKWTSDIAKLVRQAQVQKTGKALPIPASLAQSPNSEPVEVVFASNLAKLKKLKAKYDPKKIWSKGWLIEPDFS